MLWHFRPGTQPITYISAKIGQKTVPKCTLDASQPQFRVLEVPPLRTPYFLGAVPAVHVTVRDNNVDQALKALKKKLQREGVFREMKLRRSYEKPSERKAREKAEAVRRARKMERKRLEREGF